MASFKNSIDIKNPAVGVFDFFKNIYFENDNFNIPNWSIVSLGDDLSNYDAFFQVNVIKQHSPKEIYKIIKDTKKPVLVCESSPFRKNTDLLFANNSNNILYRLGWDHYLRQGKFNNTNCPSDRWKFIKTSQNIEIKPWQKKADGHILLCLQKPNDSSLNSLYKSYNDYNLWIEDTISLIRQYSNRHIVIRPHLKAKNVRIKHLLSDTITISPTWQNRTIYEGGAGLQQDFQKAYAVVAYNSNVLVESTCEGIPSFPLSNESIIWDIGNRIENLENPNLDIDITQWLYNTSYMVWTKDEILNGVAWNHLKEVYFK